MPRKETTGDRKRKKLRDQFWPGSAAWIWDMQDQENVVGFATMTRLMPWVLALIKELASRRKKEGKAKCGDPSTSYVELWCRDFGQGLIRITEPDQCAFAAGYDGPRGVRSWEENMQMLVDLGFILAKREGMREYGQVLLLNPLGVCARLHQEGRVSEEWWTSFSARAADIGAMIPEPLILPKKPSAPRSAVAAP
jgi:hypothetical protein